MNLVTIFYCFCSLLEFAEPIIQTDDEVWESFLEDLYKAFSQYAFQKNVHLYNVANLDDWGKKQKSPGLRIHQKNYQKFLQLMFKNDYVRNSEMYPKLAIDYLSNFTDNNYLKSLNNLIDFTVRQKPKINCASKEKLTLKGNFIKLSDLPKKLSCTSTQKADIIEILATDTVFIDHDLVLIGAKVVLIMIAPRWSVQGKRNIKLMGIRPPKITPYRPPLGSRLSGKPGKPGGPSGNFVGLGTLFDNEQNLIITTEGGQGGEGQDGADGPFPGDGGAGGLGALPGLITIFHFEKVPLIKQISKTGKRGTGGDGGQGIITITSDGDQKVGHGDIGTNNKSMLAPRPPVQIDSYFSMTMRDYKNYVILNLKTEFNRNKIFDFLTRIFQKENSLNYGKTVESLIGEFLTLEKHFNSLYGKVDLLFLYKMFLQHIENQSQRIHLNDEEKIKLWMFLYTATFSKVCTLEKLANGKFISNLENFLDLFSKKIEKLKNVKEEILIANHQQSYKKDIDKDIAEADYIIAHHVLPLIKDLTAKTEKNVQDLLDEVAEMMGKAEQNKKLTKEKVDQLRKNYLVHTFVGVFNMLSPVVGGTGFQTLANTFKTSGAFTELFINSKAANLPEDYFDFQSYLGTLEHTIADDTQKKIRYYKDQVQTISRVLNDGSASFQLVSDEFGSIVKEMDSWDPFNDVTDMFIKRMDAAYRNIEMEGLKRQSQKSSVIKDAKVWIKSAKMFSKFGEAGISMAQNLKDNSNKIKVMEEVLEKNENVIGLLKEHEKKVKTDIRKMVKNLRNFTDNLNNKLAKKSAVKLDVVQNFVQRYLQDTMWTLQTFTKGFKAGRNLDHSIQLIMNSVNAMINIYQKVQEYQKRKRLVDYYASITSSRYKRIEFKDPGIAANMSKLDLALQNNIILLEYTESINQLKQFVFPVAKSFFKDFDLPMVLQQKNTKEKYLQEIIDKIESFKLKIREADFFITRYDHLKHRAGFYNATITGPFFVWNNRYHRASISKLFSGEEVVFQADLSSHGENAIKFNYIHLHLKTDNRQRELDAILEDFTVSMTHMGDNYYNCNNKTYLVVTDSQNLQFSFKKVGGRHIKANFVFEKLRNGDFMLSPFTTWKIQLKSVAADGFDRLRKFAEEVDLALIGEGEYFENDPSLCGSDVDEHYELVDISQKEKSECLRAKSRGRYYRKSC